MASPEGISVPAPLSGQAPTAAPAATGVARGVIPAWMPVILGVFAAVGPVSTDIYLPAFPELERSLHASAGSAGMTLSAWMIGLAVGQITMGPLADRFGRRLPMLFGMAAYALGSIGCALSTSLTEMCVFRFIAAVAASASIVIPSACVRDLCTGNRAAKLMSRLILIQGVVPILAPMLGGMALAYISWRAIFWASAAYGIACVGLLAFVFPETLPRTMRRELRPVLLLNRYVSIMRDRAFLTNTFIWGFGGFLSFTYLTAAPTVFERLFGFTPSHYGMLFGLFAVGMIGAAQVNGALVGKLNTNRLLGIALVVGLIGALALFATVMVGAQHPTHESHHMRQIMLIPIVAFMMITLGTTGVTGPNAMVGALSNQPHYAGSASALAGTFQYALGSLASTAIGLLPSDTPIPMAALMLIGSLMMCAFAAFRPYLPQEAEHQDTE